MRRLSKILYLNWTLISRKFDLNIHTETLKNKNLTFKKNILFTPYAIPDSIWTRLYFSSRLYQGNKSGIFGGPILMSFCLKHFLSLWTPLMSTFLRYKNRSFVTKTAVRINYIYKKLEYIFLLVCKSLQRPDYLFIRQVTSSHTMPDREFHQSQ